MEQDNITIRQTKKRHTALNAMLIPGVLDRPVLCSISVLSSSDGVNVKYELDTMFLGTAKTAFGQNQRKPAPDRTALTFFKDSS